MYDIKEMQGLSPVQEISNSLGLARLYRYLIGRPRLMALIKIVIVYSLFFIGCFCRLDPDFGWHLQSGNYFRAFGIPAHDVFTYTARSFSWIDHSWGNDVLFSYLYQWGGYGLLAAVFAGLWSFGLLFNAWRARLALLLMAVLAILPYVVIRPTAWDVVGLALMLKVFAKPKIGRSILWLPVIILVWTNLHGGFVLGLVLILYFGLIRRSKSLLAMFGICILTSFINPYGPRLYVEVFRTLFDFSLHFETNGMAVFALQYSCWLIIAVWGAGFWLLARKKLINWFGLSPIFLVASIAATRNVPLFAVVATPEADAYYTKLKKQIPKKLTRAAKSLLLSISIGLIGITVVFLLLFDQPSANRESVYPVQAVSYLKLNHCQGNLFNDFNYGGFLIWQLPNVPIYIDGRMPSWRNPSGVKYYTIYSNVIKDDSVRRAVFKQYDIGCVLVENDQFWQKFVGQLQAEGWKAPVLANGAVLLVAPSNS